MKQTILLALLATAFVCAQAPDNTKTNQRDRAPGAVTADEASMSKPDQEIAQKIRKAIVDDKSLSTYAHNVKVIVQEGRVTLKGPVRTAAEKTSVNAKAVAVVGAAKVVNQVDIAPDTK